eukprot:TRINITY_DN11551_c0_g1_i1.p1 TRINITY_DN11551_c0_g1~~TRINITY_DN11551_c0_g1_i1.p1  ORF type:complete len:321 (+),score=102.70 TRINITY_DN11551_c0_g1_i1:89-1051(+)
MPYYLVNRSKILQEVLEEKGWECAPDPTTPDVAFTMWSKCTRPHLPAPEDARLQLLPVSETCAIDNKKHLHVKCKYFMKNMMPETYGCIEDAPTEDIALLPGNEHLCPVWFLKRAASSGGKDVICGELEVLLIQWRAQERHRNWILQRGVRSCLIDSRKWTLRCYVLLMGDGSVWLHREALAIIHKTIYSEGDEEGGDIESEAHIEHSGCVRYPFSKLPFYSNVFPMLSASVERLFTIYQKDLNKNEDASRYHFFGLDYIVDYRMRPILIEANFMPNMSVHSDDVGRSVKRKVFSDMYTLMIAPKTFGVAPSPGGFVQVV